MPDFDPNDHMMLISGKEYLPVAARIIWLRSVHPDAIITTEIVEHNAAEQWVIVKATVALPSTGAMAHGHAWQKPTSIAKDYVANGETSAVGRAIGMLGYGTLAAGFDTDREQVVDAPVARPDLAPGLVATAAQRDWYIGIMGKLEFDRAKAIDVAQDIHRGPFEKVPAVTLRDIVAAARADRITYGPSPETGHVAWRIVTTTEKMASRAEALLDYADTTR